MTTILIVEDEPLVRMGLVDLLEDAGFDMLEAKSAPDAMIVLEASQKIDVIITDIEMPGGMNGLELSHVVSKRWPATGIMVTSGRVRVSAADLPQSAVFISKPYDPNTITAAVETLVATHSGS